MGCCGQAHSWSAQGIKREPTEQSALLQQRERHRGRPIGAWSDGSIAWPATGTLESDILTKIYLPAEPGRWGSWSIQPVSPSPVDAGLHSRGLKKGKEKTEHECEFGALTQYNPTLKDKGRDKLYDGLLWTCAGKNEASDQVYAPWTTGRIG